MTDYIYVMKGLKKSVGARVLFKETYLSFFPDAKIGIIGPNGSGKSTLMKIMAGLDKEFDGEAWAAKDAKVGYLAQEPQLDNSKTVIEEIYEAVGEKKAILDAFEDISNQFTAEGLTEDDFNDLIEKQAKLQDQIDAQDLWGMENQLEMAMSALDCPDKDKTIENLSGGEKRRVALCKLLLTHPDILLLDEPTNHLDAASIAWLEDYLKNYSGCVIIITHDRYFLDNITQWILEIDRGNCVPWEANYSTWLKKKQAKLELESKQQEQNNKSLRKELDWINHAKAKNKARISAYYERATEAENKRVQLNTPQIIIPNGPRLGDVVVRLENIGKKYDDKVLMQDFSCIIPPGAIVGIVGPNGAGKSTLFNMITGKEKPDSGKVVVGSTVSLGYVDQSRDDLSDKKNIWQEISDGQEEIKVGNSTIKSRAYVAAFNFKGADQQKIVSQLSGGERNRVHMAKLLKMGANVILLDEPSNDLDVDTIRGLEAAIDDFVGCAMVISHDRWFLDRIATHIISFDGPNPIWFEGNYMEYKQYAEDKLGYDFSNARQRRKKLSKY